MDVYHNFTGKGQVLHWAVIYLNLLLGWYRNEWTSQLITKIFYILCWPPKYEFEVLWMIDLSMKSFFISPCWSDNKLSPSLPVYSLLKARSSSSRRTQKSLRHGATSSQDNKLSPSQVIVIPSTELLDFFTSLFIQNEFTLKYTYVTYMYTVVWRCKLNWKRLVSSVRGSSCIIFLLSWNIHEHHNIVLTLY